MPSPGFRRSLPLLDLSPAESTQIRIDPEQELPTYELALAAAQAGSLGGSIGGPPLRAVRQAGVGYADFADELGRRPVVFRGIPGQLGGSPVENPLSVTSGIYPEHGPVAFGTTNPQVAATYAKFPQPWEAARLKDLEDLMVASGFDPDMPGNLGLGIRFNEAPSLARASKGKGSAVYPLRLNPNLLENFRMTGPQGQEIHGYGNPMTSRAWNRHTTDLRPGDATLARGAVDPSTGFFLDTHDIPGLTGSTRWERTPSDQYAWTEGVASPAGKPLNMDDINDVLRDAGARLGEDPLGYLHGERMPGDPDDANLDGRIGERTREVRARRLFDEVGRDPRFAPTFREKAGGFLKSGGKGLVKGILNPANILMDATIGAGVGAASALAGYAAGQPRSAGVFNLPGEYQQALSQEDLLAQIEAKNVRKEALRQKYIDEVNALHGAGTLQPGARIEEISNYLGPVRGLQGR